MSNFIPFGSRNRWSQIMFAAGLGVVSGYYLWKEPLDKYFEKGSRPRETVGSQQQGMKGKDD